MGLLYKTKTRLANYRTGRMTTYEQPRLITKIVIDLYKAFIAILHKIKITININIGRR